MNTYAAATAYLRRRMAAGLTLERFLASGMCGQGTPSTDTTPNVCIRRQGHHLAVTLEWRDGRCESAVYDARRLWADMVSTAPRQLELWAG